MKYTPIYNLQPKIPIIGRETPGLTYILFARLASKEAVRRKRAARRTVWNSKLKRLFTFGKYTAPHEAALPL